MQASQDIKKQKTKQRTNSEIYFSWLFCEPVIWVAFLREKTITKLQYFPQLT